MHKQLVARERIELDKLRRGLRWLLDPETGLMWDWERPLAEEFAILLEHIIQRGAIAVSSREASKQAKFQERLQLDNLRRLVEWLRRPDSGLLMERERLPIDKWPPPKPEEVSELRTATQCPSCHRGLVIEEMAMLLAKLMGRNEGKSLYEPIGGVVVSDKRDKIGAIPSNKPPVNPFAGLTNAVGQAPPPPKAGASKPGRDLP